MNENVTQAEVESTSVNDNPATHTPQEQAVIEAYKQSVNDGLKGFIERVRGLKDNSFRAKIRTEIETQTDNAAQAAATLTGVDTTGYTNIIKGNAVQHIDKRHGVNGTADHSMQNIEDFARIGFVLDNFTDAEIVSAKNVDGDTAKLSKEWRNSDNTSAPLVRFSMPVNGTYYVVEAVPASNAHVMAVVSAYMTKGYRKNTLNQELSLSENQTSSATSKTNLDSVLGVSNQTIASPTASVNTQNTTIQRFVRSDGTTANVSEVLEEAGSRYGTIPAGENPVREVSLPQSVDGKTKVSRFARTAAEAQVTTDEMVSRIEQMVADGSLNYEVYSNKQALNDGARYIRKQYERGKSIEQIRSEFIRDAERGFSGAERVATGTTLYADAVADGNYQAAADILLAIQHMKTNSGQTIQAARLMKSMTPEGRVFLIQGC